MKLSSRTGLLASPTKKVQRIVKKPNVNFKAVTGPAPFTVKPYAGLYNPYPYGCSLLCNHPADGEVRKMMKKAKDNWVSENKSFLFPDEIAAIRAELEQIHLKDGIYGSLDRDFGVDSVPEELFKRYTEMDSRPLTPAPTLISAHTRASAARRCVTPDPMHTSEVREKTLLVLDLRRSHSQETLSWYGSTNLADTPLIRVTHVATKVHSPTRKIAVTVEKRKSPRPLQRENLNRRPKSASLSTKAHLEVLDSTNEDEDEERNQEDDDDGEIVKRRGRRRRKRGRDSSVSVFRTTTDPETLVATIGSDSQNPSTRPSLNTNAIEQLEQFTRARLESSRRFVSSVDSYLDYDMIRHLRRELNNEIIEMEFNIQRRHALQEAMKTVPKVRVNCPELTLLQKEINLPIVDMDLCLSLPRMFSRSSTNFELPMDSREFNVLTPIEYLRNYVSLSSTRKLLYNCIFNIYKVKMTEEEEETEEMKDRKMLGKILPEALGVMMGGKLSDAQRDYFLGLLEWKEEEEFDFKTFGGICAACERLLAKDFYSNLPDKKLDPCNDVETVDFESLDRRLHKKTVNANLKRLLYLVKES